jgi:hypothetical protein
VTGQASGHQRVRWRRIAEEGEDDNNNDDNNDDGDDGDDDGDDDDDDDDDNWDDQDDTPGADSDWYKESKSAQKGKVGSM